MIRGHGCAEGAAHLTLCIGRDGRVEFYPTGDPDRIVEALATLRRLLNDDPNRARCIAGVCGHGCERSNASG